MPMAYLELPVWHSGPVSLPRCSTRGCAYPGDEELVCKYHRLFQTFTWSMTDNTLATTDFYDDEDPFAPVLYVQSKAELDDPESHIRMMKSNGPFKYADETLYDLFLAGKL